MKIIENELPIEIIESSMQRKQSREARAAVAAYSDGLD